MDFQNLHKQFKVASISGRYINLNQIAPILQLICKEGEMQILGHSAQNRPIHCLRKGRGKIKILMWSQMHGNESTTTKGLLDFVNLLQSETETSKDILDRFTFCIIPMLNPDGSEMYTRVNANGVDLNRDFQNLSQPESQLLMQIYESFAPDYCFNLHDQRTIFGVGMTGQPATISFLAPSYNDECDYNAPRLQAVDLIVTMTKALQQFIPGKIGRFDDVYNINCVGDTFQTLGTATILIEAGHFPNDYEREVTRRYIFIALLSAFTSEPQNSVIEQGISKYLAIEENIPNFFDIIYRNVLFKDGDSEFIESMSIQYQEVLNGNKIELEGLISKMGDLEAYFGHVEYDAKKALFSADSVHFPILGKKANFLLDNNVKIVNGLVKN